MRPRHDYVLAKRWDVRDGEHQFCRPGRHDRTRPPFAIADPCPTVMAGRTVPTSLSRRRSYAAWQKIWRCAWRRPHACAAACRTSFLYLTKRHCLGESLHDAVVDEKAVLGDAGVFVRPIGKAGACHLCRDRIDRFSSLPPAGVSSRIRTVPRQELQACASGGRPPSTASHSRKGPNWQRHWRARWRPTRDERRPTAGRVWRVLRRRLILARRAPWRR